MTVSLRPYQQKGVAEIRDQFKEQKRAVLYVLPTGGGKCLGKGTPVLMYDGTIKPVENVTTDDLLMGPDSKPRKVHSLARGQEMMYRITPVKGDPYIVNESHILSLKRTNEKANPKHPCQKRAGEIVNISVREYMGKSKYWKHLHKGWRAAVNFPSSYLHNGITPYILGIWLGDGTTTLPSITSCDHEIVTELMAHAASIGCELKVRDLDRAPVYYFTTRPEQKHGRGHRNNTFWNALRELDLIGNKHIPHIYMTSSRKDRLELLAGLIDSDGSHNGRGGYDLVFKIKRIADETAFVARSLGMSATISECIKTCTNTGAMGIYYRIHISGETDKIPCRIARKKAPPRKQKKSVLVTGIKVEPIGIDDYYGFEIDGDHLFMLGDFTVTHNTYTFSYIAEQAALLGNRVLVLEHRKELIRQASTSIGSLGVFHRIVAPKNKIAEIRRTHVAKIGQPMISQDGTVAVASVQTLARRMPWLEEFNPALIIIDEAHHAVAGTWARIIEALPNSRLLGVTATPCRTDGQGLGDVFDAMVEGPTMADLIEEGSLVPPRIFGFPVQADLSSVHMQGGDLNKKELEAALDKPTIIGDAVSHYRDLAHNKPAIVFCAGVKHAKHVAAAFQEAGYRFEVVTGDMEDDERDRAIYGLAEGRIHGIVTVDVVSEGTDIPVAEVAIMLRATESESLYLQQAGRVLRPAPGKEYGLILDHVGNVLRHGRPQDARNWTLNGRKKRKRGEQVNDEGPKILQCPSCYMVHEPMPACPSCGHQYEARHFQPRQIEGKLEEYMPTEEEIARKEARQAQGRAQSVDQMVQHLGYSEKRAKHIVAARIEKQNLQKELIDLINTHTRRTGSAAKKVFGFGPLDVKNMKPKQLRESISAVSDALFMIADNDAQEPEQRELIGGSSA